MSRINNPDNDIMIAQQEKDLRHPERPQPDQARSVQEETAEERLETDLISNEGIGAAAYSRRPKSETEQALDRARSTAREQENLGRRRRS
jgi:hypothetical protein